MSWLGDLFTELVPTKPSAGSTVPLDEHYTVVVIEGCEYIQIHSMRGFQSGYYAITHKGNCKNPIHGQMRRTMR